MPDVTRAACGQTAALGQDLVLSCPNAVVTPSGLSKTRGWTEIYANCYLVVPDSPLSWTQALTTCSRYGGRLAEPVGFDVTEQVGNLLKRESATTKRIWTGYNRRGHSSESDTIGYWSDGRATTVDVGVWGAYEPKVTTGDCAYLQQTDSSWKMYMGVCDTLMPFVCQALPCPSGTFRCDSGKCIGSNNMCNGENNCGDFSDERNCNSKCSYYLTDREGVVTYPSGADNYQGKTTCQWAIEGAVGSRLQVSFLSLATEKGLDFVEVWVGGRTIATSTLLHRLSGTTISSHYIISPNNNVIVRFFSDFSFQFGGFSFRWNSDFRCDVLSLPLTRNDVGTLSTTLTVFTTEDCQQQCVNSPTCVAFVFNTVQRSCQVFATMPLAVPDPCCELHVKTCPGEVGYTTVPSIPNLGGTLYATVTPQRLHSPLYPVYYLPGATIAWTIIATSRRVVSLEILDIDLAVGDTVTVLDGDGPSSPTVAIITQGSPHNSLISTGTSLYVLFKTSDIDRTKRGFLLSYQSGCDVEISATSGTISSPGYTTGQYPSILSCSWLLSISTPLRLNFNSNFRLENGKDFLQVYEGNNEFGTPVHSGSGFTGSGSPGQVSTEGGRLYVRLSTSATGTDVGFTADFTAGCPQVIDSTLEIQPTNYARYHGDRITVSCKVGYVFSTAGLSAQTSVQLTCSEGKWSISPVPSCSRVFCGSPPNINNGALVSVTGLYGSDSATYTCNTGYSTTQQQTVTCLSTGQWATPPSCSAPTCPPLPSILNGNFEVLKGNDNAHGSVVRYSCIVGYDIIGVDTLTCNQGVWSGNRPLCDKVKCGLPYVDHATLSPSSGVYVNEDVTVSCDSGYQLSGPAKFKCGIDTPPQCNNINECTEGTSGCAQLCSDKDGGFTCSCNEGYRPLSAGSPDCEDINECDYNNGECSNTCENFPGGYRCSCPTGYQLYTYNGLGGILIPIGETGDKPWNLYHINHTCIRQKCPAPALTIPNGQVLTTSTTFSVGDLVTYICDIGFIPQGETTLQCVSSNTWSASFPVCVAASCPELTVSPGSTNAPTVTPKGSIPYLAYFRLTCSLPGGGTTTEERPCYYNKRTSSYQVSSTSLTCPSVDCGSPPRISGTTSYITSCTKSGCQFLFECKAPLFTRNGTSSYNDAYVRCGSDGQWDFNSLRCIGPVCSDPGTPPGGEQVVTSYEEFSLVSYRCDRGFLPTDPYPLECVYNYQTVSLQWNGTMPNCTDQQKPVFYNCPSGERSVKRFQTLPNLDPNPQDNTVLLLRRSVSPPNFQGNKTLIASDMLVLYEAEDYAGNIGTCTINIKVIDEEPPVLVCRDSFNYQLLTESEQQTFDVTTFASASDNTGVSSLQFSVTQLTLDKNSIGTVHTITVTASDAANNEDTCNIQVTVTGPTCQQWTVLIQNGQTSCQNTAFGNQCTITCNSGYTLFEENDAVTKTIQCAYSTGWPTFPQCVRKQRSPYRYAPSLRYVTGTVITTECETAYQNDLSNKIASLLPTLSNLCQGQSPSVTVSLPTSYTPVTISSFAGVVTGTFNLEFLPHGYSASQYSQCVNTIRNIFTSSNNLISSVLQLAQLGNCAASSTATYSNTAAEGVGCYGIEEVRSSVIESGDICVACPAGFVLSGGKCSQCGPHSYREIASLSCLPCPPLSRNFASGLTSLAECYRVCPQGMFSTSGEAPCNQCPENTYSISSTSCQPCPTGQFTRGRGHTSSTACRSRCQPGTYSSTGLAPCLSCPKAYYQPLSGATTCVECSPDTTTPSVGSSSSGQCIIAISTVCDSSKCANGGTCRVVNHEYFCDCPPAYTGRACETVLRGCDSSPCYNNAYCLNSGGLDYTCYCQSSTSRRYSGERCEIDRNDCEFNPCRNYGSCHDKVGAYACLCPSFSEFTGSSCSQLRQPCTDNPCPANAQCVAAGNLRRKCVCSAGLTGQDCTKDIDECLSNPCLNGGTCRNGNNSFSCECGSDYGGKVCEVRNDQCLSNSCGSQGTCVDDYMTGRTLCVCASGYESVNNVCVLENLCSSTPCMNGATCESNAFSYSCRCLPGYEGFQCQHETDECASNPCKNGATCVDNYLDYACICDPANPDTGDANSTYGKNCEDLLNDCTPFPCDIVGTIRCNDLFKDYQCTCRQGYYGKNCSKGDTDCESFPCRHGATCIDIGTNAYVCSCPNGFTGKNCETRINFCTVNPCINGGTCINSDTSYVCNCPPGFLGLTCSGVYDVCTISRPCLGSGSTCLNNGYKAVCECAAGLKGDNCEQRTAECSATTCENGGTCNDNLGTVKCTCPAGTSGDRCETNVDDCASGPCPTGSLCIDGINSYTCQCQPDKIGETCQKDVSADFDVAFPGPSTYLVDALSTPQKLGSQSLSLSVWLRYTAQTPQGIIATLYGLSSSTIDSTAQELLRLEKDRVMVKNPSNVQQAQMSFTSLDDGRWHHIVLVWDSASREFSVYIDGTFINVQQYNWNTNIPSYIWLVLDGTYDSSKGTVDQSRGMVGRISRLSLVPRKLTTAERENLYSNKDFTPSDAILGFTSDMLDGINGLVDYNSELTSGVCVAAASQACRTLDAVTSSPQLTSCPSDQLRIPPRESIPEWPVPVFSGATSVRANYVSGETKVTWGTYGVAYAGSDEDGDAAICTFRLFNRRTACVVPTQPLFGDETCTVIEGGFRCTVQCNQNNFAMAMPGPKYYSCGIHGMYAEADTPLPYELSACTSCTTPKHDIVVTMDFLMTTLCSPSLEATLQTQIQGALSEINNQWRQELCNAATCSSVDVQAVCITDTRMMTVTVRLLTVKAALTNANSLKMSAPEILAVAIIDEEKFHFQIGTPIVSSFLTADVPTCDGGRQLTGDCCAECGQGTYFNTDLGRCVVCQRGSYLADVGQVGTALASPCQLCTGGKTTPNTGAQTEDECRVTCSTGNFYNLTVGQCQQCGLGFYQPGPGTFYCEPCGLGLTTEAVGSDSVTQCGIYQTTSDDFVGVTTTSSPPNTGASTGGDMDWTLIVIIIVIILLLILLVILIVCCCCRGVIERCCPCLVTKVVPEGASQWHYVDRFGETNMKFVSYKMGDYRAEKTDKQALVSETGSEDGSVQTNISVQVPIFEEKLNGTVTKKQIFIANSAPKETRQEKRPKVKKVKDEDPSAVAPKSLPPLPSRLRAGGAKAPTTYGSVVLRPPSAFNKKRPTLNDVPPEEFVSKIQVSDADDEDGDYR
ncbi:uncharacterized protein [Haliotis cracherodii]|uniref:uncharacterized protein n=1 Tax=Haliotis cracherodii TaxID=6455 RepID=UPI0039ED87AC